MFSYRGRTIWQDVKEDLWIITPFVILVMTVELFVPLTPLAFIGFTAGPALIVKTIIRYRRGDYRFHDKNE